MGSLKDILTKEIPGPSRLFRRGTSGGNKDDKSERKRRPPRKRFRLDIAIVLMVLAGPAGVLYYLSMHRRMYLRRSSQVLSRIRLIVSNNAPLAEGLYQVALDAPRGISQILTSIAHEIEDGYTLSEALAWYPSVIPELYLHQIRIGEETGQLVPALGHVLDAMVIERENRETAFTNYSYVFFVFLAQMGVITFLWMRVLPVFVEIVEETLKQSRLPDEQIGSMLPYRLIVLLDPLTMVSAFSPIVAVVTLLFLAYRFSLGQRLLCPILYRVPLFGRLMKLKEQMRVAHALKLLARADIPLREALVQVRDIGLADPFRRALDKVSAHIEQGSDLKDALRPARRLFTADFREAIIFGEYSGTLKSTFEYAATSTSRNVKKLNRQISDAFIPTYAIIGGTINLWVTLIMYGFIIEIANVLVVP